MLHGILFPVETKKITDNTHNQNEQKERKGTGLLTTGRLLDSGRTLKNWNDGACRVGTGLEYVSQHC